MSGIYGIVSKADCIDSLFYGTDYHSHLGTEFGGFEAHSPFLYGIGNLPEEAVLSLPFGELPFRSVRRSVRRSRWHGDFFRPSVGSMAALVYSKATTSYVLASIPSHSLVTHLNSPFPLPSLQSCIPSRTTPYPSRPGPSTSRPYSSSYLPWTSYGDSPKRPATPDGRV